MDSIWYWLGVSLQCIGIVLAFNELRNRFLMVDRLRWRVTQEIPTSWQVKGPAPSEEQRLAALEQQVERLSKRVAAQNEDIRRDIGNVRQFSLDSTRPGRGARLSLGFILVGLILQAWAGAP